MSNLLYLFLLTTLGSLLGLIGGITLLYSKKLSTLLERYSIPFAAGTLITVALLGLLPEAYEAGGESAFLVVFLAFFAAFLFENVFFGIHHHTEHNHKQKYNASALLVIVGDTIHNFIDGVAIGASFAISPGLGLVTAFSTFLHEVPHEVGDFGILLKAGWSKKSVILINIFSGCATFIGAFGVYLFSAALEFEGILLAISAGIFLYLGAIDFLPHIGDGVKSRKQALLPLAIGSILIIITLFAVPHAH
jgi:zinc and cadmium transporter